MGITIKLQVMPKILVLTKTVQLQILIIQLPCRPKLIEIQTKI